MWTVSVDGTDLRSVMDEPQAHGDLTSGGGAWGKDGRIVFTHSQDPPAIASPLVREDFAVAAILLTALMLALVAVVVVQIGPPFGAYAAIIGISTAAYAAISQEWRFVPAAVVGGLSVDLLVRICPERWKAMAAGAGSAAALVIGAAVTVAVTSGLGWSPTLIAGVLVAGVFLGSLLAVLGRAGKTASVGNMTAPSASYGWPTTPGRVAWLALFFGIWLVASLSIVIEALEQGLTNDVALSPYHVPFYLCLVALGAVSIFLVIRATRQGRPWSQAFPAGYGSLGVGLLVILAWFIVDAGWREGVGIQPQGIETGIAPSRVILAIGVLLIMAAPLRAALRTDAGATRWPAVFSAALLAGLVQPLGFHPAQSPWLEHARVVPSGDLWVMNADGSHQTRLLPGTDPYQPWHASWSPDAREIAFTRARVSANSPVDDVADIWIVEADGTVLRPVAQGDTYKWLPHWSPDGRRFPTSSAESKKKSM
jgi:hypothetical protein